MEHAAASYRDRPDLRELLSQAARELLLLESSDWEFLVTTYQARDYAIDRFNGHLGRFNALRGAIEGRGTVDLEGIRRVDELFSELDLSAYRP